MISIVIIIILIYYNDNNELLCKQNNNLLLVSDSRYIFTNITFQQFYLSKWTNWQGRGRIAVLVVISITVHQEVSCGMKFMWGDHLFTLDSRLHLTNLCVTSSICPVGPTGAAGWWLMMKIETTSVGLCSQHNMSKREVTWWEGPGWDRGHDNPSGRSRHVRHLLPVLSVQTPAAGSVGKYCRENTLTCQHTALDLMCCT